MRNKPRWYPILLLGLFLLLATSVTACQDTPTLAPPIQLPPVTESPPESPLHEQLPTALIEAEVARVIDGDTIEVDIGGSLYKVRYIGIDTPETVHPQKPVECFGREASEKNRELVEGKTVRLEKDVSETDKYGRLLRYVWVGDTMVNAELVRLGYAQVVTYPPDVKYQDLFLQLQREAKEAGRGLWASEPPEPGPTPMEVYGLSVSISPSGAGSVTPSGGDFESGTQVNIAASPASGWQFDHWSGDVSGTSPTVAITMDANKSVTACFKQVTAVGSNVQITKIFYDGLVYRVESDEYVEITNLGSEPQDLAGWVLKDISEGYPSFTFPSYILASGANIRVYTNEVHPESGGFSFGYGKAIWNNKNPDTAALFDTEGREVSRKSY